jgi:hypothetical protein
VLLAAVEDDRECVDVFPFAPPAKGSFDRVSGHRGTGTTSVRTVRVDKAIDAVEGALFDED